MIKMGKPTSIWLPEEMLEIWLKFKEIAKREGSSAGRILIDFIANCVRIHEPGNPQWPLPRFFEKNRIEKPSPDKPMPDYRQMTDRELLELYNSPRFLKILPQGDRMVIGWILKKRGLKTEETL